MSKFTQSKGDREGQMIWDAIDMIMPLRGLLSLSCLDLHSGRHTCCEDC
jgi:hypothetical protein